MEVEYLAASGTVLKFTELDPASNPPRVQISFGMISLGSPIRKQLEQKRLDFVGIARDEYGHGGVHLRSDSVATALFVPFYAQGLPSLEDWLFARDGFDKQAYGTWKSYQLDRFRQGCRLDITHEPDVDHFFRDDYCSSLTLHGELRYLVFPGALAVPSDYVSGPNTRYTPSAIANLLTEGNQWVIWQDTRGNKIGIGNGQFVKLVDLQTFSGLLLSGYYWRDSPAGLRIYLLDKRGGGYRSGPANYLGELELGADEDKRWPDIVNQLEDFLGYPCQYVEDRQYY